MIPFDRVPTSTTRTTPTGTAPASGAPATPSAPPIPGPREQVETTIVLDQPRVLAH
jgi:hypothetical protein